MSYAARTVLLFGLAVTAGFAGWVSAQEQGRTRAGSVIYEEHCARCHGLTGRGDGPDAAALLVKPANLHSLRSRMKTDFELLSTVAYGIAYSPMHGWRGRLTDEEMLEVIEYVRILAPFYPAL